MKQKQEKAFIKAADAVISEHWALPEVDGFHVVALEEKQPEPEVEEVTVVEEEIVAEQLTLAELEAIREEAYQDGFNQGREDGLKAGRDEGLRIGHQEGLQQGQQKIEAGQATLAQMVNALASPMAEQSKDIEACLVQMVVQLSESVVQHELSHSEKVIADTIAMALAELPAAITDITIHVNPADMELAKPLAEVEGYTLQPDPSISSGSCAVATINSFVEYSRETRFRHAAEQLLARLGQAYKAEGE